MVSEADVRQMAKEEDVTITSWSEAQGAELGVDGLDIDRDRDRFRNDL